MFDEVHRVYVQGVPKKVIPELLDLALIMGACLNPLCNPAIHCVLAQLISGTFISLSTGSELQWGNWAAHELQL